MEVSLQVPWSCGSAGDTYGSRHLTEHFPRSQSPEESPEEEVREAETPSGAPSGVPQRPPVSRVGALVSDRQALWEHNLPRGSLQIIRSVTAEYRNSRGRHAVSRWKYCNIVFLKSPHLLFLFSYITFKNCHGLTWLLSIPHVVIVCLKLLRDWLEMLCYGMCWFASFSLEVEASELVISTKDPLQGTYIPFSKCLRMVPGELSSPDFHGVGPQNDRR